LAWEETDETGGICDFCGSGAETDAHRDVKDTKPERKSQIACKSKRFLQPSGPFGIDRIGRPASYGALRQKQDVCDPKVTPDAF
jgi:hypothetical protein